MNLDDFSPDSISKYIDEGGDVNTSIQDDILFILTRSSRYNLH